MYIAICDDETEDLELERTLLERNMTAVCAEWELDTFTSSKDMLNSPKTYNMVFLDVEMDGLNGIKTAESLHRKNPQCLIFFVTHHEDYMDEALDNHAFRFWTKPINEDRLLYSLKSAVKRIEHERAAVTVTSGKRKVKILVKNIIYVYHSGRLTHIVTTDGTVETYDTFRSVIKQLSDEFFTETHGSCYVNMNYVFDYNRDEIICEHDGTLYRPLLSVRKYAVFNKRFREWSGGLQ